MVGVAAPRDDGPYRLQALLTVAGPAAIGAMVSALVLLAVEQARAPRRPDRLASRLVLLLLLGAIGVRLSAGRRSHPVGGAAPRPGQRS